MIEQDVNYDYPYLRKIGNLVQGSLDNKNWVNVNEKEEWELEFEKCKNNPYYFATTYLTIENNLGEKVKFTTPLNEKQFNNYFKMKDENKYNKMSKM